MIFNYVHFPIMQYTEAAAGRGVLVTYQNALWECETERLLYPAAPGIGRVA